MPPRVKKIVITEIADVIDNPMFDDPEDTKPIKVAKVRKPRKPKIVEPVEIEKELEAEEPIMKEHIPEVEAIKEVEVAAQASTSASTSTPDEPKKKYSRNPTQYNILVGEFLKKISLEDKDKNKSEKMNGTTRLKKAQEMYKQWKAQNA